MAILKANIAIRGTRTLAINHFGPHSLPLESQEKTGIAGNDPEEWRRNTLLTPERALYLPPTYPFACIKQGGKNIKRNRTSLQAPIASTLQVADDQILLYYDSEVIYLPERPEVIEIYSKFSDELPPAYIEQCGVVNPSTKKRNIRYRVAVKPNWHCTFTILWDGIIVDRKSMEQAVISAGQNVGLGDGRGSIGYGRFQVTQFEVL